VKYGTILSWNSGLNANYHNVFLGTNFNNVNKRKQQEILLGVLVVLPCRVLIIINQGNMKFNQTYYWRIDEIHGTNNRKKALSGASTTGSHPIQAYNPIPLISAISVDPDTLLTWSRGLGAVKTQCLFSVLIPMM